MMLLAEVARQEGLFDWLAAQAVRHSRGSAKRLFLIVYVVGTIVTVLLSNDATAVVLTPAVYAATRAAKVEPLPYLFVCAFIANAASFVLPISNPANLVVFGKADAAAGGLAADLRAAFGRRDRCDLSGAAADATPRARLRGRRDRGHFSVDARRQARGVRNRADGGRAAGGFGHGPGSRTADLRRRCGRDGGHSSDRTAVAAAGAQGHFLVRAAAGGRPVHPGRRAEPDRRAAGACGRS